MMEIMRLDADSFQYAKDRASFREWQHWGRYWRRLGLTQTVHRFKRQPKAMTPDQPEECSV